VFKTIVPHVCVLKCQYNFEERYKSVSNVLSGFTNTKYDRFTVQAWKVCRGKTGLVELTWQPIASLTAPWLGCDMTPNSPGFLKLRGRAVVPHTEDWSRLAHACTVRGGGGRERDSERYRTITRVVLQGGLTQVEPNRISNKKYNGQLLSATVKDALIVQGISETYDCLEEAVKQSDIPVGRALQAEADPGALGRFHEVGAGARVAPVQVIHPSPHLDNPELFWFLPEQARPIVFAPETGLPKLRYLNPQHVPAHLLPGAAVSASSDDDDAPLRPAQPMKKRRRQPAKSGPQPVKKKPIQKKKRKADPPALRAVDVRDGEFVITHDSYATPDNDRGGYAVCQIVGANQGTPDNPCWAYKHLLSSVEPWKKSALDAHFGCGAGSVVDGGSARVQFYNIVSAFNRMNARGTLPARIKAVLRQHREFSNLEEEAADGAADLPPSGCEDDGKQASEDDFQPYDQICD
jgi:hypothetical protein